MKEKSIKYRFKNSLPLVIALFSFSVLILSSYSYSNYKMDVWEKDVKTRLYEIMMTKVSKLEIALYSRIHYTKSVAAYVSLRPEITNAEFHNLAAELINKDSVISTMALSKDCIISAIYPFDGHEAAIGLDLLAHPARREIVEKTIETHKTFVAGPVELVEGGMAFISYTPIFDKSTGEENKFWGVTDIVIKRDMLITEATLNESELGFLFAIRGFNGLGENGDVWWGNNKVFDKNPLKINIKLPDGEWILAAVPENGWSSYIKQDRVLFNLLVGSSLIISFLIWLISRAVSRIKRSEQELNAIFHSMNSLIFEFDQDGRYVKIPPISSGLLALPKEEMINKTLFDVLPESEAQRCHDAILECLNRKKLVQFEYELTINGESKWFAARVSWKSEESVIFHAFDITEQKKAREEIIQTGHRLKELNATKDKFFSIIAHDLKSPFNIILGYSDILKSGYADISDEHKLKYISEIDKSSKSAYNLLENLLLWARSQSNKIELNKEELNLHDLVLSSTMAYLPGCSKKNIDFENLVPDYLSILADKNAISTVIANLFSNAVKFTRPNGKIIINAERIKDQIQVCVCDNGVGIPADKIPKLFKIEESVSTYGTNKEKGTGLGLLLCKEFIEKHKGSIRIESVSEEDNANQESGSRFYFSIPV